MRLILAIPAVSLLCTGALHFTHFGESAPTVVGPVPAESCITQPATIWADTAPVYKAETLDLHFAAPNPTFLGVIDPAGKFFYVVFPAADAQDKLLPLVASEAFVNTTLLSISTAQFKADPYTYGIKENQPVFTMTGTYRFIMGENLHIDDAADLQVVEIQYVHTPRPVVSVAAN